MPCLSKECLQEISDFTDFGDELSDAQHRCKLHKEDKGACLRFDELHNQVSKREDAILRACKCKLEKVA